MASLKTSTHVHPSIDPPLDGEARIARLFEMTSDLLAMISLDGRFTLLNPAWEQLLGWTQEELRARPVREQLHPEDNEQALGPKLDPQAETTDLANNTTR
jgi:PAS domain S-box-containing protein